MAGKHQKFNTNNNEEGLSSRENLEEKYSVNSGRFSELSKTSEIVSSKVVKAQAVRKKFATQMKPELIEKRKARAKSEGRQIQAVVEDAVRAHLEKPQGYQMRPDGKAALETSLNQFDDLYKKLAQ